MRNVTYALGVSLDGYTIGPDGAFDFADPDEELFRFATDEVRALGAHLMGRRLYESMLYWETAEEDPTLGALEREFARVWKPIPKVVFSNTLTTVEGHARLATLGLAGEIERLRAESADGDIAIGGSTLAAEAASLDLIDEYRPRLNPVLVGGGVPYFARDERRSNLELVSSRLFGNGVLALRYRVVR